MDSRVPIPIFMLSVTTLFCCKGYCMDLLKELSKTINFTYSLALSPDGQFGSYVIKNSTGKKKTTQDI